MSILKILWENGKKSPSQHMILGQYNLDTKNGQHYNKKVEISISLMRKDVKY